MQNHVAGAQQNGAIVQAEFFENGFGIAHQSFVLLVAFLRMREFEELDLLELVLAEDTAGVLSSGSGFGAEAAVHASREWEVFLPGWFRPDAGCGVRLRQLE